MNLRLLQLFQSFNDLSLKERVLIMGASVAVLFFVADLLLLDPARKEMQGVKQEMANWQTQIRESERKLDDFANGIANDPVAALEQQEQDLQQQLVHINDELQGQLGVLIDPDMVNQVLEEVLRKDRGLQLLSMEAESTSYAAVLGEMDGQGSVPEITRYDVTLKLEGDYLSILRYLETLEALPWKLFWKEVQLTVVNHPLTRTTLKVYTLRYSKRSEQA